VLILVTGCWVLVAGYWVLVSGSWVLVAGNWILAGQWVSGTDIVGWLSGCKYGFISYLQNNWTLHVSKERTSF
jgi:hypothetical protein